MTDAAEETRKVFLSWGFDEATVDAFIEESGLRTLNDPAALRAAREVVALCRVTGRLSEAGRLVAWRATLAEAQAHLRGSADPGSRFIKAQQAQAIRGNPAFDEMALRRFTKRAS